MPVNVVPRVIARTRNGVGAFVLPCRKITLQFCQWGGSSDGMRVFIAKRLQDFAKANSEIQFDVLRKNGHPVATGSYMNGRIKPICVRGLNVDQIEQKLNLLRDSSGSKLSKPKFPVSSTNSSVRGIWSPFHKHQDGRFKV